MKQFFVRIFSLFLLFFTATTFADEAKPNVYIFLGPPASGKGTQAKILARELGLPHISTGDLLRDNIRRRTELGLEAEKFMNRGELVSDDFVFQMVKDRLARPDVKEGYILDGFPRTVAQAQAFDSYLNGQAAMKVIYIDVPDEIALARAEGRKKIESRADDAVAVERMKVYHDLTAPLVKYYADRGILLSINGDASVENVHGSIIKNIGISQ